MNIIAHRRNTIEELKNTSNNYGVEVDIRSEGQNLIIHHDPFASGISLNEWIQSYQHGTLILNVKEEGLEARLLELMALMNIKDFFFLDQSFPFLVKSSRTGESRCAVRVSEFESIDTALSLAGKVEWVWIDCFSKFPLNETDAQRLKAAGFKLCLVSPELHGRDANTEVPMLRELLKRLHIEGDAVCTKRPDLWENTIH